MSQRIRYIFCLLSAFLLLSGCQASSPTEVTTPAPPTSNEAASRQSVIPISDLAAAELVVRTGPGEQYASTKLQLGMGQGAALVGRTADCNWLLVEFGPQQGWIQASQVEILGSISLVPVVPTPTVSP